MQEIIRQVPLTHALSPFGATHRTPHGFAALSVVLVTGAGDAQRVSPNRRPSARSVALEIERTNVSSLVRPATVRDAVGSCIRKASTRWPLRQGAPQRKYGVDRVASHSSAYRNVGAT